MTAVLVGATVTVAVCVRVDVDDGVSVVVTKRTPLLATAVATIGSMLLPYGKIKAVFVAVVAEDVLVATTVSVSVCVVVGVLVIVGVLVAVGSRLVME